MPTVPLPHRALVVALALVLAAAPLPLAWTALRPGAGGAIATVAADAWRAPVEPVVVVEPFDGPAVPWAAGHRGVDLDAPVGTPVRAPRGGVVTFAGVVVDRPVLTVRHDDGLRSSVEPVAASVAVGDRVTAGSVVGTVTADRSHCDPACVHWGVRDGDVYLDPMLLLRGGPVVLLARGGRDPDAHDAGGRPGTRPQARTAAGQPRSASVSRARRRSMAAVCICEMRDSVTPSTRPISASVMPS